MYSCTLGKVLNLVICLRYMYFFKKYLKLLRLYFRYRYVSLPDCLATMAAGGHGGQAIRQPASSRIPRRAIRVELRTVESQNSLRNRGLLYERSHFRKETAPVALRAATCVQNRKILRPIGPSTNFLSPIARFFAKVIRRDSEASP